MDYRVIGLMYRRPLGIEHGNGDEPTDLCKNPCINDLFNGME